MKPSRHRAEDSHESKPRREQGKPNSHASDRSRPALNWVGGLPRPRLAEVAKVLAARSASRIAERAKAKIFHPGPGPSCDIPIIHERTSPKDLAARLVVAVRPNEQERAASRPFLTSALGGCSCQVERLFDGARPEDGFGLGDYFVVTLPYNRGEVGSLGHDLAYGLLELDEVKGAYYEGAYGYFAPLESALCPGQAPIDMKWSHEAVRLPAGLRIQGQPPGTGIVIGHPDTGWAEHPELEPGVLDLGRQWSTLDQAPDARDPMDFPLFKGHGTSTASVLAGREAGAIAGIASGATIIPIRCIRSVAVVLDVELARAVWYASQNDVHVISMSAGGHAIPWLEGVIAHAIYKKNIIVCAAAGNGTPFVVFPAAYPDCIAVASTTPTDRPAESSSRGPQVTISAPGHKVWEADFDSGKPIVKAGCGTSYATPHVAGAAAIWLHKHGRDRLLDVYRDKASLQEVFKLLLRRTARNPGTLRAPGDVGDVFLGRVYAWNPSEYGAGILNIQALLDAPLPEPEEAARVNPDDWAHTTWTNIAYGTFHDFDPQQIEGRLARLFGGVAGAVSDTLDQVGAELSQLWMDSKTAFDAFAATGAAELAAAARETARTAGTVAAAAENAATFVETNVAKAVDAVARAAAEVTQAAADAGTAIGDAAQDAAAEAKNAAEEVAAAGEQLVEDAKAAADSAAAAAQDAAAAVAETVEDVVDDASDAVSDTLQAVMGLFH